MTVLQKTLYFVISLSNFKDTEILSPKLITIFFGIFFAVDSWNTIDYVFRIDAIEGSEESWLLRKLDRRKNVSSYISTEILYDVHNFTKFRWPDQVESPQKISIEVGYGLHVKKKLKFGDLMCPLLQRPQKEGIQRSLSTMVSVKTKNKVKKI